MLRFDRSHDLDRLAQQMTRPTRQVLAMDAVRDDEEVTIYFDVPGVHRDDIDVTVEKNELTVTVERRWRDDAKRVVASERSQGTFERQLVLSDALDTDRLSATLDDGVLIVKIPVDERAKQRKIDVSGTSKGAEPIDAGSAD